MYVAPNTISTFELCDGNSCAYYSDNYVAPTTYATDVWWVLEDGTFSNNVGPYSTSYQPVHFDPITGNQNIVDDSLYNVSYTLNQVNTQPVAWGPYKNNSYQLLAPGIQRANTYFDLCPGYWFQGGPTPTTC